jgi:hypothetical protein
MPDSDLIRVLGYTGLRGSSGLYLVSLGAEVYLIGSGENGLSLISTITDKETLDTIKLHSSETAIGTKMTFSDIIVKMLKPKAKAAGETGNPIDFLKKQKERLQSLK